MLKRVSIAWTALLLMTALPAYAQKVMPIGSSSMQPTFSKDDEIRINLLAYALKEPSRWDVVTYQSIANSTFRTHRIVGVPGDTVSYGREKILRINGNAVGLSPVDSPASGDDPKGKLRVFIESLDNERHLIQIREGHPSIVQSAVADFPSRELCKYESGGFSCVVPRDHYFVMGDNRDMAADSRYVGFIPAWKIAGKVENMPGVRVN